MAQAQAIIFNIGVFISALFLLEFGGDKFIAQTAIVANRIGVPEVVVGLLTAGAEWEEVSTTTKRRTQWLTWLARRRRRISGRRTIVAGDR